jgi:hypothetical protein
MFGRVALVTVELTNWADQSQQWPAQVRKIAAAVEEVPSPAADRRRWDRLRYRVRATLRLKDAGRTPECVLFTRDANPFSLGFITWHRLPVGAEGVLHLPLSDHESHQVPCCIMRCRDFSDGWYEGAVFFLEEQPTFSGTTLSEAKPRQHLLRR